MSGPAGGGAAVGGAIAGRSVRHRDFRLLWAGEASSRLGSAMTSVALPLVAVTQLDATAFQAAMLYATSWLPWLVIGLPAGAWVDRLRRLPVMIISDVLSAVLFLSIPVAAWSGVLTIAQLLLVSLAGGALSVFFQTAQEAYLPSLLHARDLPEGNAKLQGTGSATQVAGPGAAGLLAQLTGPVTAVLVDAVSFAVSALLLAAIRFREPRRSGSGSRWRRSSEDSGEPPSSTASPTPRDPATGGAPYSATAGSHPRGGAERSEAGHSLEGTGSGPEESGSRRGAESPGTGLSQEINEGIRFVLRDPYLRVLAAQGAASNIGLIGYQSLLVVFLVREVGVSSGTVGGLLAAIGCGGVLGAVIAAPLARRLGTARAFLLCEAASLPFGLLIPLTGPGAGLTLLVAGGLTIGIGVVAGNVIKGAFRQRYTPPHLLGRVMVTMQFLNLGAIPLGALAAGTLAGTIGVRQAIWCLTAGLAVTGLILLIGPLKHARDLPDQPSQPAGRARTARHCGAAIIPGRHR